MGHFYADESKWDGVHTALLRQAERGRPAGLDTEFYNIEIRKQSCAGGQSRIHLWSVAINRWPLQLHPRGYYGADAAVLPAAALEHRGLRSWLESSAPKCVHNLSVDDHSLHNAGVTLGGQINTLARARFCYPERARGAGFALDDLGLDILGVGKTEDFKTLFSEQYTEVTEKVKKVKGCVCGVIGCRKRKPEVHFDVEVRHDKVGQEIIERTEKVKTRPVPLESVVPGHLLWERVVAYAARDAVLALGLNDVMERMMPREVPFPWSA